MSTTASAFAARLNTLKNGMDRLALEIKAEFDGLPNLKVLIGDDAIRLEKFSDRRTQILDANSLHTQATAAWRQSRDALVDNNDLVAAERLYEKAVELLEQARQMFGDTTPSTSAPAPASVPTPPAPPASKADDPAKGKDDEEPRPAPIVPTPSPAPAPAPVQSGNEAPAWVADLQSSVRGALEQNAETIRAHVDGCNTRLDEFGQLLDELRKGTLKPELADMLNGFSEDELRIALTCNAGGGNADTDEIKRQLDELAGQISADDLRFLSDLRAALVRKGLSIEDLVAGAELGAIKRNTTGWLDARRRNRAASTSPTPGSHT
jgi:hypothetical protein